MKFDEVREGDYAVFKSGEGYCVIRKGSKRCAKVGLKKPEAVKYAKGLAKKYGVDCVLVEV
jgi:hypothetical protein